MTAPSPDLIERLLFEAEGDALDFKSAQYRFVGAGDDEKGELLKDILAFANSWRRTDAYILIGVAEVKGDRGKIVGVESHLEDASLQQFVNSKVQRPIRFSYSGLKIDGTDIAVIHIPMQDRPFYLEKPYGRLEAEVVYVRRGSSTARARLDEIARMGSKVVTSDEVALNIFIGDPETRKRIESPRVRSRLLSVPKRVDIPSFSPAGGGRFGQIGFARVNSEYFKELAAFTATNEFVKPLFFAIENRGHHTAHDVLLEISFPVMDGGVAACDEDEFPSVPRETYDILPRVKFGPREVRTVVQQVGNAWVVTARVGKVQPAATMWLPEPIYLGAAVTMTLPLEVTAFADNLPRPHKQTLHVAIEASAEVADLDRIQELEDERIRRTSEYRPPLGDVRAVDDDDEDEDSVT